MNFTRRPCESRSPPQTLSNSSIEIFFVDAITEFFTITLFIFKLLNFLFLSCLPEASCSDWTMQRYGVFSDWPRFWRLFAFSYCDRCAILRHIGCKPHYHVASIPCYWDTGSYAVGLVIYSLIMMIPVWLWFLRGLPIGRSSFQRGAWRCASVGSRGCLWRWG